jgi:hypothetical protein
VHRYAFSQSFILDECHLTARFQDAKRPKLDPEISTTKETPSSDIVNDSALPTREQYLQTYFKNEVNAILRKHKMPLFRKLPPNWPSIAERLQNSVSIKSLGDFREDYDHGWQNWDGNEFSKLHKSLKNSNNSGGGGAGGSGSKDDKKQSEPAATITPKHQKLKFKPVVRANAKPKAKPKTPKEDYHPEDGEYTAATSVSSKKNYILIPLLPFSISLSILQTFPLPSQSTSPTYLPFFLLPSNSKANLLFLPSPQTVSTRQSYAKTLINQKSGKKSGKKSDKKPRGGRSGVTRGPGGGRVVVG